MAHRTIKFEKGEYYHIYNRGCGRERIFRSKDNYRFLQGKMRKYASELKVTIVAYCLMPNHYHFVLHQDGETSAGYFAQQVFNSYTKAFNKMYSRSGTLFEGPFEAKQIDDELYLLSLCRYVHRNPLEAGLVKRTEDWEFSDYLSWISQPEKGRVDSRFFQGYFGSGFEYERFVVRNELLPNISGGLKKFLLD